MSPYRSIVPYEESQSSRWMRWVGWWVYGGEPTCGHCRYWRMGWKEIIEWSSFYVCNVSKKVRDPDGLGDCKLLYGDKDKKPGETCDRFKARFRYKHWMRRR